MYVYGIIVTIFPVSAVPGASPGGSVLPAGGAEK